MNIDADIRRLIRYGLKRKRWTQTDLARRIGMTDVNMSYLLTGYKGRRIPTATAEKILRVLGCKCVVLGNWTGPLPPR